MKETARRRRDHREEGTFKATAVQRKQKHGIRLTLRKPTLPLTLLFLCQCMLLLLVLGVIVH